MQVTVGMATLAVVVLPVSAYAKGSQPSARDRSGFEIDAFRVARRGGETFKVSGSGCPPVGSLPTSAPVFLRLTPPPPQEGNRMGPLLDNGRVGIGSNLALVPGETDVTVTPAADGTFTAKIQVPVDAGPSAGYTVRGFCTTLLDADPVSGKLRVESELASYAQVGFLEVLSTSPRFQVERFTAKRAPGESFTVKGSGCPPAGPLTSERSGPAVTLRLTPPPPHPSSRWAAQLVDGTGQVVSSGPRQPGETDVTVTPKADGTFATKITVPTDAPTADGYTVRGLCTSVLETDATGRSRTEASISASRAQGGYLTVVADRKKP